MASFTYKATARDGSIATGTLSAADRSAAFLELDAKKLQALSLTETAEKTSRNADDIVRLKSTDILHLTEELSELLKSGIPLEQALGIIERRDGKSELPRVASSLRLKIRDGSSLSDSLSASCPDFGSLYCRLVAAGEESGSLAEILARHAIHLKALQSLRSKVVYALIYPAFLTFSAIAVSVLFIVFLIPKLMELLDSTGGTLPAGAQIILSAGEFFQNTWPLWLVLLLVSIPVCRWFSKNHPLEWDRFVLKIPLFGRVNHSRQHVQFLETMASLTGNGLPIIQSLTLTRNSIVSPVYTQELDDIFTGVTDGDSLSTCIRKSPSFPGLMADLIAVGEQTGDLAGALERAVERFDTELSRRIDRISATIQPAVVVVMAGMVGALAYLMISAIFQTMSGLGT